jgi:hypothetical protein
MVVCLIDSRHYRLLLRSALWPGLQGIDDVKIGCLLRTAAIRGEIA